ncbi:hypothetical protein JXA12_01450 [Candidatus Woesearchaeota archaeon]|nr:hypothetical protein [Candidatus Woesearchaeota archaeon]
MANAYLSGILEIANVFISLFVLIYAWSFLRQTADVRDRRPWVFLFIAAVVFFIFEVVGVLNVMNLSNIPGLHSFLESAFIALILFVFIFQYDLILKSDLILITRKIAREEELESKDDLIRQQLSKPLAVEQASREPAKQRKVTKKRPAKKKAAKKRRH